MNMVSPVAVREVIDCDLHIGLTDTDLLMPYLPDYWREQVVTRGIRGLSLAFTRPGAPGSVRPDWRPAAGIAGASLERVQAQALDPFDTRFAIANCLYGGQALLNADQGAAICAATNDWIAAEWLDKDSRLRASIVVPWQLPELAVAEIERWAHDKRFVQVLILVSGDMPLGKRLMWPIYEAAEKYGLPLGIHAGTIYRHAPTGSGWPSYQIEDEASFSQAFQQQLLSLLMEGVFAKFPRLKVVMLESGVTWLPFFFSRIDKLWKGLRMETPWVDRLPSEIVRDQVRFTLQPFDAPRDEDITHKIVDQIGSDRVLLFSTDYPHWHFDGTEAFPPGFDAALRRRMTVDNPLETYTRLSEGLA